MSLSVIIVAAGSGRRMGFDKLLAPLQNEPVLLHTIRAFATHPEVSEIILVCPQDRYDALGLDEAAFSSTITRIDGGTERHHSVSNGLAEISPDSDYCAIHDGARPLISHQAISKCYTTAQKEGAAALARPATETIKRVSTEGLITESVSRENLWFMETPQIFSTQLIKKAYEEVENSGKLVTDEVSALQLIGVQTQVVLNESPNVKITYPQDLPLAEMLLQTNTLSK